MRKMCSEAYPPRHLKKERGCVKYQRRAMRSETSHIRKSVMVMKVEGAHQ